MYGELNSGIPHSETGAEFLRGRGVNVDNTGFISLPMRLKDGDDASCLNLNRTESPAIIGVNQNTLDSLGAFAFSSVMKGADKSNPWQILGAWSGSDNTVYGVADANTIEWGLGKSVGDVLTYIDDFGDTLSVVLAAGLENSLFQGRVIIAESDFLRHYPSISGYRLLLLSSPPWQEDVIAGAFRSFHDKNGLELVPAAERLNAFNAVENTYLSIFALLGMMGLVLGCAGLGIVVMRDIEGRRHELAVLLAQGFSVKLIKKLLLSEHALVAVAGALLGLVPAILVSGAAAGLQSLAGTAFLLAIVLSCGIGSIALGLRRLRKDNLIEILKRE
jgi:ABC-type antimicrobial peptide transport system permease subunit